ncbi:hypothetical protein D9M68_161840 [compost metagenome]
MKSTTPTVQKLPCQPVLSLCEYDRLLGAIHDGALDNQALTAALEAMRQQFRANFVTLILRIPGMEDVGLMLVAGNLDAHGQLTYFHYHRSVTPFTNQPVDTVFTERDMMSEKEWLSSSYFLEHCQCNDVGHVMGADISTPDCGVLRFRITRSQAMPAFSEEDRTLCTMLLPHLRRSLHMHNLLGRSESLGSLYAQAINRLSVATIVLDEKGAVLQLNDVARDLLKSADGLKLVGGRLEATYPSDNRELHKLFEEALGAHKRGAACDRDALSIARPSGEVSLGVVVEPIPASEWADGKSRPTLVVYVRDAVGKSQVNNAVAKQLFNFTPAETALALELANGLSLEEAAENLGIMRNTARAHLRAIFSKTGVRRQAELVRVMLNSVVTLGGNPITPFEDRVVCIPRVELRPYQRAI